MVSKHVLLVVMFVFVTVVWSTSRGKTREGDTGKRDSRNQRYHSTDAPEPLFRPSAATDHGAEKFAV